MELQLYPSLLAVHQLLPLLYRLPALRPPRSDEHRRGADGEGGLVPQVRLPRDHGEDDQTAGGSGGDVFQSQAWSLKYHVFRATSLILMS